MEQKFQTVGCVIVDDYDRILLVHRNANDSSRWELPGGKVWRQELPESVAVEEVREMLAVDVRLLKSLGSGTIETDEDQYISHWFQARIIAGDINLTDTETFDDYDYFELEDLMSLSLSDEMLVLLPRIIDGEVVLGRA